MTTKYHKTFGEVEVVKRDNVATTIVIIATGEEKRLLNKFADTLISDTPFVKAAKKFVKTKATYTEQDEINVAIYQERARKEMFRELAMTAEQRAENAKYRQAGSSLR